jgi:hypothetical protein
VVFIRATLDLPVPVNIAIEHLDAALAQHRLDEVSDDAYGAGLVVLIRVGPFGEIAGLSKKVRLELLPLRQSDRGVRLRLRWVATGATGQLFPALDATSIYSRQVSIARCRSTRSTARHWVPSARVSTGSCCIELPAPRCVHCFES